jgi:hypothetical protein
VLMRNTKVFSSNGTQTYTTVNNQVITFEIDPKSEDQSQMIQIDDIDSGSPLRLERNYRNWPLAWSANKSIQSVSMKGRWTFDSAASIGTDARNSQQLIYDVTDALHPKRLVSTVPVLTKYPISAAVAGQDQYFDDSGTVLDNDSIQSLEFRYSLLQVSGFRMVWCRSGLQAQHGSQRSTLRHVKHQFAVNETIVEVGIGSVMVLGQRRIIRIRMVTNRNVTLIAGYGKSEEVVYTVNNIIAFHGRVNDGAIQQLGIISLDV